jgi:kumamolisin
MTTTPKNLTDQLTITVFVRRPTFEGMTVRDHADGIIAGTHQVLDHNEFESMFGADDTDIAAVVDFVKQAGLTIGHAHSCSASVKATGTVGQLNTLFGITLNDVTETDKTYINYTGTITLPGNIQDLIKYIDGLDTSIRPIPKKTSTPGFTTSLVYPQTVATAYNFPGHNNGTDGVGQVVGIIEPFGGGGYTQDNLTSTFIDLYGVTVPTMVDVLLDGVNNDPTVGSAVNDEIMLDIAMVGGIMPKSTIVVYFCSSLISALNAVLYDTEGSGYLPKVISGSFAYTEGDNSFYDTCDELFVQAVVLGVTFCIASGDWGAYAIPIRGIPTPAEYFGCCWPASNPHVLAVGGTSLALNPNGSISQEVVWNNNGTDYYISGGNQSSRYLAPDYQNGLTLTPVVNNVVGSPTALLNRGVPDVALVSDPNTGCSYYYWSNDLYPDTINRFGGGTSMAAPLFAGFIARINQTLGRNIGFVNNVFYTNPNAFNDITPVTVANNNVQVITGNGFMTTVGWDATTGIGSPKGASVLALFASNTGSISVTGAWSIGSGWTWS